jgi:AcrR family transcriptional regulator
VEVVAEKGYEATTVDDVIARAGVGADEFYRRFSDLEDCALKAYEAFIADFKWRVGTAYARQPEWRTALRAAAYATADWMTEMPKLVPFGTVEVLAMKSEMARVRREEVFIYCAGLIDEGRKAAADPDAIPPGAAMVAIGSIMQLLTHKVQKGAEIDPHGITPEMMYAVVRTYLGEAVAREEFSAPRPDPVDYEALR